MQCARSRKGLGIEYCLRGMCKGERKREGAVTAGWIEIATNDEEKRGRSTRRKKEAA